MLIQWASLQFQSHSKPLSNEELYDLAEQLTEQQKEDEDEEDRGTKAMQTKELTDIFPLQIWQLKSYAMSTLTGNAALQ